MRAIRGRLSVLWSAGALALALPVVTATTASAATPKAGSSATTQAASSATPQAGSSGSPQAGSSGSPQAGLSGSPQAGAAKPRKPPVTACSKLLAREPVSGPLTKLAWQANVQGRTPVFSRLPGKRLRPSRWLTPADTEAVLVLSRPHAADGHCWVRVRLPWRPNNAAGWIRAGTVVLDKTPWRIEVSRSRRALTLLRGGKRVRTVPVVVGKPSTPTPTGLFAITWAIPWHPNLFLGSWVLELTGHSNVLQTFDGGDGTVGIHGRGGSSLLDPLGTASSHGCIRLANDAIDWLVRTVGEDQLPGTPVHIS